MAIVAQIEMELCTCWKCGVQFAVSRTWIEAKFKKRDAHICCPNGHEYRCVWRDVEDAADLKADNEELRREIVRIAHEAEQNEARLRDERRQPADALPDVPADPPAARPQVDASGRLLCPECGKSYVNTPCMRKHLEREHRYDYETACRTINAAVKARAMGSTGVAPKD